MGNKYHTVGTVRKSNRTIVEAPSSSPSIPLTPPHLHDRSLSWLGTDISMQSGRVKPVLWVQASPLSEMMHSYKCSPLVDEIPTLKYNRENSVVIKNRLVVILNFIHYIFKPRDTDVVISSIKESIVLVII